MTILKPLFFAKYKSDKIYPFDQEWIDLSKTLNHGYFSVKAKAAKNAKGIVVLAHPMKDLGKYFFVEYGHAELYHQLNYHVVVFDFNGFGQSEDNGFAFPQDVEVAIDIAKEAFPNLPIGLHGVSFGGSQIILAAIERQDEIAGVLIESAVSSNLDYYKGRAKNLYHILNLYNILFPKKNAHNLYYNEIKKIEQIPLLFVYGTKDVITPLWMGENLYKHAKTQEKTLQVFDTKHLTTLQEQPVKYKEMIQTFWAKSF